MSTFEQYRKERAEHCAREIAKYLRYYEAGLVERNQLIGFIRTYLEIAFTAGGVSQANHHNAELKGMLNGTDYARNTQQQSREY